MTKQARAPSFKLDENLPHDAVEILTKEGFDASSVYLQRMSGRPDSDVAQACQVEGRVLVTLDLDFSDIRSYPHADHAGIVVIRQRQQDRDAIVATVRRLVPLFRQEPLTGVLWIVSPDRIRIRG